VLALLASAALGPATLAAQEPHPGRVGGTPQLPVLRLGAAGDAVALLQVVLGNREFSSGVIDGRFGPRLEGALLDFQRSRGLAVDGVAGPAVWRALEVVPDETHAAGFRAVVVTPTDTVGLAVLPESWEARGALPVLPYGTPLERLSERYQASADYLQTLNPGVGWPNPPPGTRLRVPAVRFETVVRVALPYRRPRNVGPPARTADSLAVLRADSAIAALRTEWERPAPSGTVVRVSTRQRVVRVYDRGRLVARYPATVGSRQFPNPVGEWRIASQVFAPDYGFDERFLETGVRSERFVRVPPGPNNIVGLVWMGLDKPGFGLHGTDEPQTIGAAASHGCVRLTNWDAERLARHVGIGTPVTIER
jgi:lipoprotein-anchoring transpeptidase ErfK/SrfK